MRPTPSTLLALIAVTFLGCRPPTGPRPEDIRPIPSPGSHAPVLGLREAFRSVHNVHVLVIHGMVTRDPNYSMSLQKRLASHLGLDSVGTVTDTVSRGYDFQTFLGAARVDLRKPEAEFRTTNWVGKIDSRTVELTFHELLWSPLRDVIKRELLACFENAKPENEEGCPGYDGAAPNRTARTWANGFIKETLMIDGFADATIVLSPLADVIRDDVDLAMCLTARRMTGQDRPLPRARCSVQTGLTAQLQTLKPDQRFYVITESLGSFLLLDGQFRAAGAKDFAGFMTPDAAAPYSLLTDATVFMFANQISLLGLARARLQCLPQESTVGPCKRPQGPEKTDWFLLPDTTFSPTPGADRVFRGTTTYVAFNDTDDFLGYDLQPVAGRAFPFGRLINVSVTQPTPTYLFAVKNPLHVHTRQSENRRVITAIVEGFEVKPLANP